MRDTGSKKKKIQGQRRGEQLEEKKEEEEEEKDQSGDSIAIWDSCATSAHSSDFSLGSFAQIFG